MPRKIVTKLLKMWFNLAVLLNYQSQAQAKLGHKIARRLFGQKFELIDRIWE